MPLAGPLVSVVTPCFNHGPYLDDYFRSLLAQTYENVELVILDDGSTDDSWRRISEYVPALERKFSRVVAERYEHSGLAKQFNRALDGIEGDLLCVLESDDYYLPTKLEENVRYMLEHPETAAVHSDCDFVHSDGIERFHWRRTRGEMPSGDVFAELLPSNFILTCTFCCRVEHFRRYVNRQEHALRGYLAGDYAWSLDLAKHASIGYIDKALARYRVLHGSMSRPTSRERYYRFHRSISAMKLDYLDDPRVSPELATQIRRDYYRLTYQQGVELGRPADCEMGYRWLRTHYPSKYRRPHHWLLAHMVRLPPLWRMGQRTGALPILVRAFLAAKRRGDRRALRAALEPW